MKKSILALMLVMPIIATAQSVVVESVVPRYSTSTQPVCARKQVSHSGRDNAGGTIIGAITGGIVGNQVGGGSGKTIATVIGALVGAKVGNNLSQENMTFREETVCEYVTTETQVGEVVTFSYKGHTFVEVVE
jgi:uncharacterized protein YcfJ